MYTSRLREKYKKEIVPKLQKEHGYKNNMAVPKIVKVVVNAGLGKILKNNADDLERISEDFAKITGQKGVITKARMAISGFKIRQGMSVGIKTTLRGNNMYDFLDKLINGNSAVEFCYEFTLFELFYQFSREKWREL